MRAEIKTEMRRENEPGSPWRGEHKTIGSLLYERREKLGLSLKHIADELQIPLRFLEGLEQDQLEIFPAKVYAKGFLRRLLMYLGIEGRESLLREFDSEWEVAAHKKARSRAIHARHPRPTFLLTPRKISVAASAVLSFVIGVFLLSRLTDFIGYPELDITFPPEEAVVIREPTLRVRGKAEKESRLTVNQRELRIDPDGHFNESIELQPGLNTLEFLVENRFGKERREVRYVVVK